MSKKRAIKVSIAVIIIMLCFWRLWPHSLKGILPVKEMVFNTISVKVSELGVSNNSPTIDSYSLDITSPDDENYSAFMSIVLSTKFRSDFRNLLPWDILTVDSGTNNITHSATIMLTWGDTNNKICYISFLDDRMVSLDISGEESFQIYHPTNQTTLNQIVAYVKENGVPQK